MVLSVYSVYAKNALVISRMNVRPVGGFMKNGLRVHQTMVFPPNHWHADHPNEPKGM